jgi:cell division protein FtsB
VVSTVLKHCRLRRFLRMKILAPLKAKLFASTLMLALFLAVILWAPVRLLARGELGRYRRLQGELGELRERNENHQRELNRLRLEVRALTRDRAAIERIARDELGLVRTGEVVLDFTGARP